MNNSERLKPRDDSPEKPKEMSKEVSELIRLLEIEKGNREKQLNIISSGADQSSGELQGYSLEFDGTEQERLKKIRIREIEILVSLLREHCDDHEVSLIASDYIKIMSALTGENNDINLDNFDGLGLGIFGSLVSKFSIALKGDKEDRKKRLRKLKSYYENIMNLTLRSRERQSLADLRLLDSSEALEKNLKYNNLIYSEYAIKVLYLPKSERDKTIESLRANLLFYKSLCSKEYIDEVKRRVSKAVENILKNKKNPYEGLRGLARFVIDNAIDFSVQVFAFLGGDESSLAFMTYKKSAKFVKDANKPVEYNSEIVKSVAGDFEKTLLEARGLVDESKVDELIKNCDHLKSLPENYIDLKGKDARQFMESFVDFLPTTKKMHLFLIEKQRENITQDYLSSHGEEYNWMFEADGNTRMKINNKASNLISNLGIEFMQGKDFFRTMQVYSPFGIGFKIDPPLLDPLWVGKPDQIKLKPFKERFKAFDEKIQDDPKRAERINLKYYDAKSKKIKEVKGWSNFTNDQKEYYFKVHMHGNIEKLNIESAWDQGFWEENPALSALTQYAISIPAAELSVLAARGSYGATRGAYWLGRKVFTFPTLGGAKILPKHLPKMPKVMTPIMRLLAYAYIAYEAGDEINEYQMKKGDKLVLEILQNYKSPKEIPEEEKNKIRATILKSEIYKRRELFQATGADLSKFGLDFVDRMMVGGSGSNLFRDDMKETGEFREALIAANRKINILGLKPFTIETSRKN